MRNLIKCFKGEKQSSSPADYIWPFFLQGDKQTNKMLIIVSAWICTWKKVKFGLGETERKIVKMRNNTAPLYLGLQSDVKRVFTQDSFAKLLVWAELWVWISNLCQLHSDLPSWKALVTKCNLMRIGYIWRTALSKTALIWCDKTGLLSSLQETQGDGIIQFDFWKNPSEDTPFSAGF